MHTKQFPEVEAVISKISFGEFQKEVGIYDSEGSFEGYMEFK